MLSILLPVLLNFEWVHEFWYRVRCPSQLVSLNASAFGVIGLLTNTTNCFSQSAPANRPSSYIDALSQLINGCLPHAPPAAIDQRIGPGRFCRRGQLLFSVRE